MDTTNVVSINICNSKVVLFYKYLLAVDDVDTCIGNLVYATAGDVVDYSCLVLNSDVLDACYCILVTENYVDFAEVFH